MELIIHRVNKISELRNIKPIYGTEIDIRSSGSNLILNHEPYLAGDKLEDYLDEYKNGTLILNIKETGIEKDVLISINKRPHIKKYFLLDIEFPYLHKASKMGEKNLAIRFSEFESIETVNKYAGLVNWVWIDTITKFPIRNNNIPILNKFKKCLVCPERWGREKEIKYYRDQLNFYGFEIDAVMTSQRCSRLWNK